ncbi:hypothetical protein HYS91_01065 [Candidatus Daviesbacteria bacterium]|nr:hypothetical protein [Candidatus Daviesbacteria bacterium]
MKALKIVPLTFILIAVSVRLLPHPANFAPITALALFGGVYLSKKYAFILPLLALFLSDLALGFYGREMFYVYGSFVLSGIIGLWIRDRKKLATIAIGSLLASILFFLITNFGVWANPNSWYSRDFQGLIQSYIAGLPFFRNTLLGDLFFTGAFFGGYEVAHLYAKKYLPKRIYNSAF